MPWVRNGGSPTAIRRNREGKRTCASSRRSVICTRELPWDLPVGTEEKGVPALIERRQRVEDDVQGSKILMVDDSADNLRLLTRSWNVAG